jgi:hypothetical protein
LLPRRRQAAADGQLRQAGNTVSEFLSVQRGLQHFLLTSAFAMYFLLTELAMAGICRLIYILLLLACSDGSSHDHQLARIISVRGF